MKYQLAIFDMDGTILNTLEDLADSLNYALAQFSYPLRSLDEVRRFVGNGILTLIERGVPSGTDSASVNGVHRVFTEHYALHCADKTCVYEGVIPLISSLRSSGVKTAVVSNKANYAVQELCCSYFVGLFDVAVGESNGLAKKPAADMVEYVLKQLALPRKSAVYIGDSEVDIATAANSGLDSIIVDWGFRERSFLAEKGAKTIVSAPEEIFPLIVGR